jgi:hypothetical protein
MLRDLDVITTCWTTATNWDNIFSCRDLSRKYNSKYRKYLSEDDPFLVEFGTVEDVHTPDRNHLSKLKDINLVTDCTRIAATY